MAKVENQKNIDFYQKKVNKRKLGGSLEYTTANFAAIVTTVLAVFLVAWQLLLPLITKKPITVVGIVYLYIPVSP